jgi:two-component system cell cycle sensor histidine kinase/response regulator CckA
MIESQHIKLLLVEDDEDDYIITRSLLADLKGRVFTLDWEKSFDAGLAAMKQNHHDVCLVDYRLGAHDGIELLQAALAGGCQAPVILLTGMGEHQVDLAAMKAGAADYLVKNRLDALQLERSIRYAIERKRAAARAAFDQARLAAFGADVGLALTRSAALEQVMADCARAMVQYLNAALAQIWVFDPAGPSLRPVAQAGVVVDGTDAVSLPQPQLPLDDLAQGRAIFLKSLAGDARWPDPAWAAREELVSFAALPLLLENRFVGMMSLYSRQPLTPEILQEMGSVGHGIALCFDRERSQQALHASEGKYRAVVETIREVIFQTDEFGHWTFLNPAWSEVTGFSVGETLGTFFLDCVHHDDREENRHIFLQLLERRMDYCRYETRFLTKDGGVRWMEVYSQLRLNQDGAPLGVSGSLNDITERKRAELQIQKLAAFPRVNPNPVLEFTADGTLTYANDAARKMVESLGQPDLNAILPAEVQAIIRRCYVAGQNHYREQVVVAGRTLTWSFFPVAAGQVVHCYGADVTDVVNLEAQFRHAQKLESVGQLAAGVAHDFNNILTVIQGYSDRLLQQQQGNPTVMHQVGQILDAAKRAANLTRQLLAFSRKQVIQTRVLDLNASIKNLTSMLSRLLGEDIHLEADFASDLPAIEADAGMIEQVVMNLAVNARDAMPQGGQLCLRTAPVELTEFDAARCPGARAGRFVCLKVEDSGCGMDEATLGRIFEPFFSTKEVGKGTGLGLATVYGIVKQHNGWIEVASQVGRGTAFSIFFPCSGKTAAPIGDTRFLAREPVKGGAETILLVEDEPDLREMVREILLSCDYRIVEAGTGVDALHAWDQADGKIDLLLTDMVMPDGMNGRELAALLRKRKPELKVIYSSGYSAALLAGDSDKLDGLFLPKPYRPQQLSVLVRQCLDGVESAAVA